MQKMPLGLPLLISMGGTIFSLAGRRGMHKHWGVIFTCLSFWHVYQYRRKIYKDFCDLTEELKKVDIFASFLPNKDLASIVKKAEIASYIPGRIRIYSRQLVNNGYAEGMLQKMISRYKEIDDVRINILTGSVLIEYRPEILRKNKELADIETYIQTRIKR
ncbi:HMA2 domain-containing protein [Pectinatus haikarae]|uniref:Uncharacterized protein n=1 Tax=Pectinatus haikarae TaxID=349096 RepID=A0ABT9Y621_9FIRM|nr:hypothetical protein [Pectinatus haikarae]MDQ0203286.1 hypothetical protein [Pectinatus haikarae]